MNQTVKVVRNYYNSGYHKRQLDTDVLATCVDNLTSADRDYINQHSADTLQTNDAQYKFFMEKLLCRYTDIVAGYTKVDQNDCIEFTTASSIIELCDDMDMYAACRASNINRIRDLKEENLGELSNSIVGKLLGAALAFSVSDAC